MSNHDLSNEEDRHEIISILLDIHKPLLEFRMYGDRNNRQRCVDLFSKAHQKLKKFRESSACSNTLCHESTVDNGIEWLFTHQNWLLEQEKYFAEHDVHTLVGVAVDSEHAPGS